MGRQEHDDTIRRSFERQVGLFSGPASPFALKPDATLAWLGPLRGDMRALEVACGAAHVAEAAARCVRQVVGVDLTRALLALGAERLRGAGVANVLLQEADAESLPFPDASFDLVFCRSALHHFADPRRAVQEMVRTCRPGGTIALSDLVAPSAARRDAFDDLHRRIDPSHVRALLEDELLGLLPPEASCTFRRASTARLPIAIALTGQSDRAAVLGALRAELAGGAATGFEPQEENGDLVVAFPNCVIQAARR